MNIHIPWKIFMIYHKRIWARKLPGTWSYNTIYPWLETPLMWYVYPSRSALGSITLQAKIYLHLPSQTKSSATSSISLHHPYKGHQYPHWLLPDLVFARVHKITIIFICPSVIPDVYGRTKTNDTPITFLYPVNCKSCNFCLMHDVYIVARSSLPNCPSPKWSLRVGVEFSVTPSHYTLIRSSHSDVED